MTEIHIDIQRASDELEGPTDEEIASWAEYTLLDQRTDIAVMELSVRLVDTDESAELNQTFRHKTGPTNVLSFPFDAPPGLPQQNDYRLLGDIVICAPLVAQEATQQDKSKQSHWAHLIIHGILHLLGYDHQNDNDAQEMERNEIRLLSHFEIPDPYQVVHTINTNDIH